MLVLDANQYSKQVSAVSNLSSNPPLSPLNNTSKKQKKNPFRVVSTWPKLFLSQITLLAMQLR